METATARVKEIHAAVDSAADTLLMDMPYDSGMVQGLQELGFTSAENVNDLNDHRKGHESARYYQQRYPHLKFITKWQMDKIREKYNLMEGSLDRFKGAIPAKNINEMMNFRIIRRDVFVDSNPWSSMGADLSKMYERILGFQRIGINPELFGSLSTGGKSTGKSFSAMYYDEAKEIKEPSIKKSYGPPSFQDAFARDAEKRAEDFRKRQEEQEKKNRESESITFAQVNKEFPGCITITADKGLFKAPDPVLDPIVTVAVDGGYLIVTAWGAEASDPDVINPIMN